MHYFIVPTIKCNSNRCYCSNKSKVNYTMTKETPAEGNSEWIIIRNEFFKMINNILHKF